MLYYSGMTEVLVKGTVPDVQAGPAGSATQIDTEPALTGYTTGGELALCLMKLIKELR